MSHAATGSARVHRGAGRAGLALKHGADEPTILGALLHDTVQELMRSDHGYWGAQLYQHYVPAPQQGLGNDRSPVAHMWRTLANPDAPL
jgi:hypothetical protein